MSDMQSVLLLRPECVFIFCGDFNVPDVLWFNNDFGLIYNTVSNPRVQCVSNAFAFYNFFQPDDIKNSFGGILNFVFSNGKRLYIIRAVTLAEPCYPYHLDLEIMINLQNLDTESVSNLLSL